LALDYLARNAGGSVLLIQFLPVLIELVITN
jgi:hypothetical protein